MSEARGSVVLYKVANCGVSHPHEDSSAAASANSLALECGRQSRGRASTCRGFPGTHLEVTR